MLDKKSLDLADGDGSTDTRCTALFFTQLGCGAQHAAGTAENVVFFNRSNGPCNISKPEFSDESSRVCLRGTCLGTGRVMAKKTAVGFGQGLSKIKPLVHLLEMICTIHSMTSF